MRLFMFCMRMQMRLGENVSSSLWLEYPPLYTLFTLVYTLFSGRMFNVFPRATSRDSAFPVVPNIECSTIKSLVIVIYSGKLLLKQI